jgi:integrase
LIGEYSGIEKTGYFTVKQARDMAGAWSKLIAPTSEDQTPVPNRDLRAHFARKNDDQLREIAAIAEIRAQRDVQRQEDNRRKITLQTVFDQWRETDLKQRKRADGKRSGRKDNGNYVFEQFSRHVFPTLAHVPMLAITRQDVWAILDAQKAANKMRTANVLLADLKQLFRFAAEREIIPASPIDAIKKEKVGGQSVKRERTLDNAELIDLQKKIPSARLSGRTEIGIWLLLSTGARLGELMGATWAGTKIPVKALWKQADEGDVKFGTVDLLARSWYLPDTKNQRDHTIHLSDFACEQFKKLRSIAEHNAWIFPDSSGTKPVCVKSFGKQIADRQRLGKAPLNARTQAVAALALSGGKWTAHDLRRTVGTMMAKLGISTDVIHECLNHIQADAMARVYIQDRRLPQQAAAFDALGKRLTELLSDDYADNVLPIARKRSAKT